MTSPEIKEEFHIRKEGGQICRLCMSEESLDDEFKNDQLKEWIWEFLAIKISSDDRMSQVVCTICRIRLTEFHQFRMRCNEVQEVLQALIPDETDAVESCTSPVQTDPKATNQLQRIENQNDTLIRCEVCRMNFEDDVQLANHKRVHDSEHFKCSMCEESFETREHLYNHLQIHTTKGLNNQKDTQVESEQAKNVGTQVQSAGPTSETERKVSSCWIRSESNSVNSDSKEDALCMGSFEKDESPLHFQDEEMENDPLGIEDSIVVEEAKVETQADDEVTDKIRNRNTVSETNLEEVDVDENSSNVSLPYGKRKLSRGKKVNDSSESEDSDRDSKNSNSESGKSDADSKESNSDSKESDSDYSDEVEQQTKSRNSDEGYKCSKCDRTFTRECRLKVHMAIHEEKESEESSHESSDEDETSDKSENSVSSEEDHENEKDSKEEFQCEICQNFYSNKTKLSLHMKYHRQKLKKLAAADHDTETKDSEHNVAENDVNPINQCDVCQKTFLTRKMFLVHKRNVHGPKRHRCDICDVQFTLRMMMTRHVHSKKHLNKIQEKLRLETEGSSNKNDKVRKAVTKQGKNKNNKKIKNSSLLEDDVYAKYEKKEGFIQAKCTVCDKIFGNKWTLANHMKYHKPKKFICDVCQKPCHNSAVLKRHLVTHVPIAERLKERPPVNTENAPRPFKCDICQVAFIKKVSLWKHNLSVHAPKKFVCEICGYKFSSNDMLQRHLRMHKSRGHTKEDFQAIRKLLHQNDESTNQKDDESDQSSVPSENESDEKAHNHSSKTDENSSQLPAEQPFQCDICEKNFESRVLLFRHKRYVHKAKRFKCPVCRKRFAYRKQRNMHMKLHKPESTATKDFECPECHKIYTSWKSLYVHVKDGHVRNKNLSEDPNVACPKCDKKFHTAQRLGVHMRTVHGPVEHKCKICKKTFSIRVQLWQHMNSQHGKESASSDSDGTSEESEVEDSVQENNSKDVSRKQPQRSAKVKKGTKQNST